MTLSRKLAPISLLLTALLTSGCGALDAAQDGLGTGKGTARSGRMCFVRDATFSGAVNGRAYLAVLRAELPAIVADDGPADVCVVDVTGNPSVSSSVQHFSLVSHASTSVTRLRQVTTQLAALQSALVQPYQRPPACLAHSTALVGKPGSRTQRRLAAPSHASAVFETFLLAARAGRLQPGDRIVGLTDGIERRGDVNLAATPLLDVARPQPAGRQRVFARIVAQGAAPRGALQGIRISLPSPGSPVCGAPYSESRGNQIRELWERDWAHRTGAQVQWK